MGKPLLGLILITRIRTSHGSCNHPDGAFAKKANNSHSSNWLRRAEGSWSKNPFNRLNPWLKNISVFSVWAVFCALSSIWMFPESHARLVLLHTTVEVSHPYRCRYLTHTGVGISPIQVSVSHPYTLRYLTHRTFRESECRLFPPPSFPPKVDSVPFVLFVVDE